MAAAGRRSYFESTRESSERAEREFEQALATYQQAADPAGEADSLLGIAVARAARGRHAETIDPLSRTLELARSLGDIRREADVLWYRGWNYTRLGAWRKAVDDLTGALPLFRTVGDASRLARTALALSQAHVQLGDRRQSLRFTAYGLRVARAAGDQYALCEALQASGSDQLWIDRPREALAPLAEALRISRQYGYKQLESGTLISLGTAQRLLDQDLEARQTLAAALALARRHGNRHLEASILLQMAGTYKSRHSTPAEAAEKRRLLEQSLAASREFGNLPDQAANLTLLARMDETSGNLVAARRLLEQAVAVREAQWRQAPTAELQASYIADQFPTFEIYIDVLVRTHSAGGDPAAAALAFRVNEGVRARALRQQLERAEREARAEEAPAALRDGNRGLRQEPDPITVAEVQRELLDADTMLLEYSLGMDRSYLFAAGPSSFRVFELPAKKTIEAAARAVTTAATARNEQVKFETGEERRQRLVDSDTAFGTAARELSRMLLAPVQAVIRGKRLVLVSDGGLAGVPFGALPVPSRAETGPAGGGEGPDLLPLAIANELIELPSAAVLREIRRQSSGRRSPPKMLAVLADPILGREDPRLPAGIQPVAALPPRSSTRIADQPRDWPRLPYARAEAEAILGMVPEDQRLAALGPDASLETATSPDLAGYRIVHFATHALVDSEDSALSGIVLSGFDADGRRRPGLLSLPRIYRLRLPADLVVLSGCRTALGEERRGEGLIGLARGFLYAGASRVVVSLWDVQDQATAELMKRFYAHLLQDGRTPAAALRLAQTEMWRSAEWSSPYYWAGFRLQGEWR
jgi:CHAT domain-containing protein